VSWLKTGIFPTTSARALADAHLFPRSAARTQKAYGRAPELHFVRSLEPVHGELPFKRRLAVQTIRGNDFANGNSQGRLLEGLGRPPSLWACRRIVLDAREPRCRSF